MANELISDGDYIFINTEYAEVYIPANVVGDIDEETSTICYPYGTSFMTLGIFYIRFMKDEFDTNAKLRLIKYPNMIETQPMSNTLRVMEINGETDKYLVLKYGKGDILMNAATTKSISNCNIFMRLITGGKIPKALGYTEIFECWLDNFAINGMKPSVPSVVLQTIISEMCRDPKNPAKQYRKIAGKGDKYDPHGYSSMNMNEVSAQSSVMSSLTFERFGEKLGTSIIMTKDGVQQAKSPIEKVITM